MKPQWDAFVQKYLETKDHISAYQHAYPGSSRKTAATKGGALLKKPEVFMQVNKPNEVRNNLVKAAKVQEVVTLITESDIITELEMDILLTKMMKGEIHEERVFVLDGAVKKVLVAPDINSRINAIDKMYRRRGLYMSDRNNPRNPPPQKHLSVEELKAILDQNLKLLKMAND